MSRDKFDAGTTSAIALSAPYVNLINDLFMEIRKRESAIAGPGEALQAPQSEKPRIMDEIHRRVGSQQVTKNMLELAPSWRLRKH